MTANANAWRPRAVLLYLTLIAAVLLPCGVAGTSSASARGVPVSRLARGSGLSLSQAPPGLRAAVGRTLGVASGPLGTSFRQAELIASDAAENAYFGISMAVYGQTAVVGASANDGNKGAAYVFVRSGSNWSLQAKLTASDAASGDQFGISVALYGQTVVIGADAKNGDTGAAYVFVRSGTTGPSRRS
jgi:hypothetical protein